MKYSGIIGFFIGEEETEPGIFVPIFLERKYTGDVQRSRRGFQEKSDQQNREFTVNNQISILSDLYAKQNWDSIRYVIWNDVKWEVNSVEINYPRLVLEIGGYYHGEPNAITRNTMP